MPIAAATPLPIAADIFTVAVAARPPGKRRHPKERVNSERKLCAQVRKRRHPGRSAPTSMPMATSLPITADVFTVVVAV